MGLRDLPRRAARTTAGSHRGHVQPVGLCLSAPERAREESCKAAIILRDGIEIARPARVTAPVVTAFAAAGMIAVVGPRRRSGGAAKVRDRYRKSRDLVAIKGDVSCLRTNPDANSRHWLP